MRLAASTALHAVPAGHASTDEESWKKAESSHGKNDVIRGRGRKQRRQAMGRDLGSGEQGMDVRRVRVGRRDGGACVREKAVWRLITRFVARCGGI